MDSSLWVNGGLFLSWQGGGNLMRWFLGYRVWRGVRRARSSFTIQRFHPRFQASALSKARVGVQVRKCTL